MTGKKRAQLSELGPFQQSLPIGSNYSV